MQTIKLNKQEIVSLTLPTPFAVGPVNVYLLKGDILTLVDTGPKTDEAWESLVHQLSDLGYKFTDIEQVIITHHHPDHVGLLDKFTHACKIGHKKALSWISKNESFLMDVEAFFEKLYFSHGVHPEMIEIMRESEMNYLNFSCKTDLQETVTCDDAIPGMDGWRVIETPGHAQSHISLYHEQSKVLIAGDHLIKHISSNAIIEKPYDSDERPKTLLQYRESLRKLLDLDISTVLPGHGEPITNPHELIAERLKQHETRAMAIKQIIDQKPVRTFDICKIIFEKIYEKQPVLTFSEILGHLDLLESMDLIYQKEQDGQIYFVSK